MFILSILTIIFFALVLSFRYLFSFEKNEEEKEPIIYDKIYLQFLKSGTDQYIYNKEDVLQTFIVYNNSTNNKISELRKFIYRNCKKHLTELKKLNDYDFLKAVIPYYYVRDMFLNNKSDTKIYKNKLGISDYSIYKELYKEGLKEIFNKSKKVVGNNQSSSSDGDIMSAVYNSQCINNSLDFILYKLNK